MEKHVPEGKSVWILSMTIHDLEPYNNSSASYYIKWARGTHKGSTERAIPNAAGTAVFEKVLSVPCTIIKHKGKICAKEMTFVAKMILGKKKKKIGDFKLDLAPFVGLAPIVSQAFAMHTSSKSTPPVIRLSVCLAQSTLDHSETTESMEVQPRKSPRNMKRVGSMNAMSSPPSSTPSLEDYSRPKPLMNRVMTRRIGKSQIVYASENSRQLGSLGSPRIPPPVSATEYEEIKNLCSMEWGNEDPGEMFHGLDSVIFAALIHFHLFDPEQMSDEAFDDFVDLFWKMLRGSMIMSSLPDNIRFCPIFGLVALLHFPPPGISIDRTRATKMANAMSDFMQHEFDLMLSSRVRSFKNAISTLFRKDFDVDATAKMFTDEMKRLHDDGSIPLLMIDAVEKGMVRKLDTVLVATLCSGEHSCNFLSSLAWNTFCSRMRSEGENPMEFTLFTEAVAVVQMTAVIEDNPEVVKDICPHLTPNAVLSILSVRDTDEDLKALPNLKRFAKKFGIDDDEGFVPIPLDARDVLDISKRVLKTDEWKDVIVPENIVENFPFLMDYFKAM